MAFLQAKPSDRDLKGFDNDWTQIVVQEGATTGPAERQNDEQSRV
jgi:hypothetical protein